MLDVLVVEDDEDVRECIASWLEDAGHRVTQAADGGRAASLLASRSFDVAICDVHLPTVDGFSPSRVAPGSHRAGDGGGHDEQAKATVSDVVSSLRDGAIDLRRREAVRRGPAHRRSPGADRGAARAPAAVRRGAGRAPVPRDGRRDRVAGRGGSRSRCGGAVRAVDGDRAERRGGAPLRRAGNGGKDARPGSFTRRVNAGSAPLSVVVPCASLGEHAHRRSRSCGRSPTWRTGTPGSGRRRGGPWCSMGSTRSRSPFSRRSRGCSPSSRPRPPALTTGSRSGSASWRPRRRISPRSFDQGAPRTALLPRLSAAVTGVAPLREREGDLLPLVEAILASLAPGSGRSPRQSSPTPTPPSSRTRSRGTSRSSPGR